MENINMNIGRKLKRIRNNKGLSLSKLEEVTGVSKSMLGQIERGESNPTVKTLWKIAKGLNVSFSAFVEENKAKVSVVSSDQVNPLLEGEGQFKVFPLFPFDQEKGFEIYQLEIAPGYSRQSEAHFAGVEEHLLVYKGTLEVIIDGESYQVKTGDAVQFMGDRAHTYSNQTEAKVQAYVLLYYTNTQV